MKNRIEVEIEHRWESGHPLWCWLSLWNLNPHGSTDRSQNGTYVNNTKAVIIKLKLYSGLIMVFPCFNKHTVRIKRLIQAFKRIENDANCCECALVRLWTAFVMTKQKKVFLAKPCRIFTQYTHRKTHKNETDFVRGSINYGRLCTLMGSVNISITCFEILKAKTNRLKHVSNWIWFNASEQRQIDDDSSLQMRWPIKIFNSQTMLPINGITSSWMCRHVDFTFTSEKNDDMWQLDRKQD